MPVNGLLTQVQYVARGSELTAAAAVGATVLQVESTVDFDDAGGDLELNGVRYGYSSADPDALTVTLEAPLSVAGAVDDFVASVAGGQVEIDAVAYVSVGDGDDVEPTIPLALRSVLPEGTYDDVPITLSDDLEAIVDIPARQPVIDGTFIDPETVPVSQSLQDQVDAALASAGGASSAASDAAAQADAALTAANAAQADADAAQTSADGKNRIFYMTSTPGSTPNIAGDTWFRRDGSGVIIAQWEGAGGTTWTPRTLDNAVIATLDAAKLTAGSAFTNALTVRNTMTLGTSSNDGIIESFNFAGSTQAVRISKLGLNAKGGTLTGALIQTDTGSTTGIKLTSSGFTAYGGGVPTLAIDAATGAIAMKGELTSGSKVTGATIEASEFYSTSTASSTGVRITNASPGGVGNSIDLRGVGHASTSPGRVRPHPSLTAIILGSGTNTGSIVGENQVIIGLSEITSTNPIKLAGLTWSNLTISSPYSAVSGQTPEYFKDVAGNVHLRGAVNRGTASSGALVATLPAGFRPTASVFGIVRTNAIAATAQIAINTAGQIAVSWSGTPSALGIEIVFSTL